MPVDHRGGRREPRAGTIGNAVLRNLLDGDFVGPVYPVNPNADAVAGVNAYPSVLDIPDPVDLAVIAVPAATVLDVVEDCARQGRGRTRRDLGRVRRSRRRPTRAGRARAHGARATACGSIGPNCMGVVNTDPEVRMNATFAPSRPVPGRVGLRVAVGRDRHRAARAGPRALGLGVSSFVSIGNKADVSGNDLLQYWEDDPDTDVILLYLESFGNPRKFARLARRICARRSRSSR